MSNSGRSIFDPIPPTSAPGAPPPISPAVSPAEPGVLVTLASGRQVFVPRPKGTEVHFLRWLEDMRPRPQEGASSLICDADEKAFAYLRKERVDFAVVTTRQEAEKPVADAVAAAAQAQAAAAVASVAAASANEAADDVASAVEQDGDVADWTDQQIRDTLESLNHKVATNFFAEGEDRMDTTQEIIRLSAVLQRRRERAGGAPQPAAPATPQPAFVINPSAPTGAAN